jgi:hypothetical protein
MSIFTRKTALMVIAEHQWLYRISILVATMARNEISIDVLWPDPARTKPIWILLVIKT